MPQRSTIRASEYIYSRQLLMTLPQTELDHIDRLEDNNGPKAIDDAALASSSAVVHRPSRLRRIGSAIARHPNLAHLILTLALLAGGSSFFLYGLFKQDWSPEKDNQAILKAIVKLEFGRKNVLPIANDDSERVVTRSYADLDPYVEIDGWAWINRFGSTLTYGRADERLIASCSTYSPLYLVCNLSEVP